MINQNLFRQWIRESNQLLGQRSLVSSQSPFNESDIVSQLASSNVISVIASAGNLNLVSFVNSLFTDVYEVFIKSYSAGEGMDSDVNSHFSHRVVVRHKTGNIRQVAMFLFLKTSTDTPFLVPIADDIVNIHDRNEYFYKNIANKAQYKVPISEVSSTCLELLSELVFKMVKEEGGINDGIVKTICHIASLPAYHVSFSTLGFLENLVLESNMNKDAKNASGGGHGAYGLMQFRDVSLGELHRKGLIQANTVNDIQSFGYRSQLWLAITYLFSAVKGSIHPNFARLRFIGIERLLCYAPNKFKREDPIMYMYTAIEGLENNDKTALGEVSFINDFASLKDLISAKVGDFLTVSKSEKDDATLEKMDEVVDRERAIQDRSLHSGAFIMSKHYMHSSKILSDIKADSINSNNRFLPLALASNVDVIFGSLFTKGILRSDIYVMSYSKQVGNDYLGFTNWNLDSMVSRPHAFYEVSGSNIRGYTGLQLLSGCTALGTGHVKNFMSDLSIMSDLVLQPKTDSAKFMNDKLVGRDDLLFPKVKGEAEAILSKLHHVTLAHRYRMMVLVPSTNGIIRQENDVYGNFVDGTTDANKSMKGLNDMVAPIFLSMGKTLLPNKVGKSSLSTFVRSLSPLGSFLSSHKIVNSSDEDVSLKDEMLGTSEEKYRSGIDFIRW